MSACGPLCVYLSAYVEEKIIMADLPSLLPSLDASTQRSKAKLDIITDKHLARHKCKLVDSL